SQAKRLLHGGYGLLGASTAVERPGHRVVAVDVLSDVELALGHIERGRRLDVAVGIEIDQLAAIDGAVDRVEAGEVLDQLVLPPGLSRTPELRVDAPQAGGILG